MGARGPLPQSDNVRQLRGNPGRRQTMPTPKVVPAIPDAPDWLGEEGQAEWDRITPELFRLGLIGMIDRAVLTVHCRNWEAWTKEAKVDAGTPRARSLASNLLVTAKELALAPAPRLRMKAPKAEEPETSDLD